MRRVVVTGLGAVTPLGVGIRRTWSRLLDGHCGIVNVADRHPRFSEIPAQIAAVVPLGNRKEGGWTVSEWLNRDEERRMATFAQFAVAATEEALEDAAWRPTSDEQREATGVCLGSGIGNFDQIYDTVVAFENNGYKKVSPLFVPKLLINLGAGQISMKYGLMGPNHAATTACTTGAHSIGDAARFIAFGDADVMVTGGAESCIHPLALGGFARARSLATDFNENPTKASRPFDADRQGFVVGEGAAVMILEELEHAKARGARIYAEFKGYGTSGDAFHITAPKENGAGALSAMRRALKHAKIPPSAVDYVNAHATSTVVGDAAENAAVKALLLDTTGGQGKQKAADINVSSTKGAIGHLLGGAGAIEAIFSVLAIHESIMPPTINLGTRTAEFDCNYAANEAQERKPRILQQSQETHALVLDLFFTLPLSLLSTLKTMAAGQASINFVDASGYKFSEKDTKPGKIKLKKQAGKGAKTGNKSEPQGSPGGSPVLPQMDAKTIAAFPSGKPREEELETVICKHCKRPQLKTTAVEHIRECLKAKQEKARKKKEARDAKNQAKIADSKDGEDDDKDDDGIKGQKTAKKGAVKGMADDGPKKGKKRKAADGEDEKDGKEPKKKKKKEEPKPKVPKPKGPVDVEKQCGVLLPNGSMCARSLTCKSHSMGAKRAVPGRSLPYDMLLQAYQKKNQARQQKAAIDANAPLQDDFENNGPVDSDEERDAVMAAISRSHPTPLAVHTLIPTRKKYHYVRMKEMLSNVLGGARGGGLFSTGPATNGETNGLFQTESPTMGTATATASSTLQDSSAAGDVSKKQANPQATPVNRPANVATTPKTAVAATS
ncbi:beta-ketoacyl synthase (Cem1), putative [Talaromyces stipitatus ATCC 10500]|uniref:beta-ketoacyl-[acyl-carrier-protein] synthase I n=1 Tax=Talaromyces stipitatus (strain ATCC 10500 / CBS 375.48 / QM 6759 / NRRL 1006) TaxID=441959 RepID=B8M2N0_TALSN|nr:beta-ketoacyl synthase (Cem1), putative [Talaromyces stipitatus ATCC 10500]EED21941.1 beta-ketoacyl synthase (Cem1), putative [Talaromyces stipitatus ATCC 10500]